MKIQTLSIVVPTKKCINNCKMCVSKMHDNDYVYSHKSPFYIEDLKRRINYAVINNVDTIILTGTGEALQNKTFLSLVDKVLKELGNPIPRIELQTSGVLLNDKNLEFLRLMGVTTISLSIMDLFNDERNLDIMGAPPHVEFKLDNLCKSILSFGFNIRLSLNMSKIYDNVLIPKYFQRTKELGASQITFRKLYSSDETTKEGQWVKENSFNELSFKTLNQYIKDNGKSLYRLPFGAIVYSLDGISSIVDDDCMSTETEVSETLKYLILREDGKLYCKWDNNGSLIF